MRYCILLLMALTVCPVLFGQAVTDSVSLTLTLDEVVVTGTGTEHYLKDAPVQTEVISGKALSEYAGRDIEDVINGLSSSLTVSRSDMGSNLQLNGLKNDYILILIDGKRINGDVGGQNDLSRINTNNIERIEIVKGAASLFMVPTLSGSHQFHHEKEPRQIQCFQHITHRRTRRIEPKQQYRL